MFCVRACARDGDCVLSSRVSRGALVMSRFCVRRAETGGQASLDSGSGEPEIYDPGRCDARGNDGACSSRRRRSSFKLMEFVLAVFDTGCAAVTVDRDAVNRGCQKKRIMQRERKRRRFVGFRPLLYRYEDSSVHGGRVLQL